MSKIKLRSKKSICKRLKVLSSGKVKRWKSYTSHLAFNKTTKQKRHLKKSSLIHSSDWSRLKKVIAR